jgi:hypothetical protein
MKIGDKVKMTKQGFQYYHNLEYRIDGFRRCGKLEERDVPELVCSMLSIMGVGEVIDKEEDCFKIRWKLSHSGVYFYSTHWYEIGDIRPLTLWEKICSTLFN